MWEAAKVVVFDDFAHKGKKNRDCHKNHDIQQQQSAEKSLTCEFLFLIFVLLILQISCGARNDK
jgi:hypothetical protein